MTKQYSSKALKEAEKGSILSLISYTILAIAKITTGYFFNSSTVLADGMNNFSDMISSLVIWIGVRYAQKPADSDHRYGHWRSETVAALTVSFIILYIGIQVTGSSIGNLFSETSDTPGWINAVVALISGIIMISVYLYNQRLAKRVKSAGLAAAAKDNLTDAYSSFGAAFTVICSILGWIWLDRVVAIVIGLLIIKMGILLFKENAFTLMDGFDEETIAIYNHAIETHIPDVHLIKSSKGRMYGANIYLDYIILVDPNISVYEGHAITEKISDLLAEEFGIYYVNVHVEPDLEDYRSGKHNSPPA